MTQVIAETRPPAADPVGLSSAEAARRRESFGSNEVPEVRRSLWLRLALRFWGPLPWMLEGTIALTLLLGKDLEAAIIATLLVVNSAIGFVQQSRADDALALIRRRLAVTARVLRDGTWQVIASREVVPGDVVRIRVGDIVCADLELVDGHVSLDQSSLTGEAMPVDADPGHSAMGASVVTRGEATGIVVATGEASYFGRTSVLVRSAKSTTHLESIVFRIIHYLVILDVALVVIMLVYAAAIGVAYSEIAPFALIILIASVPVALPTVFTVAQALGAVELGRGDDDRHGVLVTRLSAVQDAASMEVLCTDKTGTLTENRLHLERACGYAPTDEDELLALAAIASDEAGQDPIDLALLRAAADRGLTGDGPADHLRFEPFDPATKRTTALVERAGKRVEIVKGMPSVVAALCEQPPVTLDADVERLAGTGARVLAVAAGPPGGLQLAGLVALADRPRQDSAALIRDLRDLGVEVKMVTGDTVATATSVARAVAMDPVVCSGAELERDPSLAERCSVFASVFPEDKHRLVEALQTDGRIVGMTGDGVNDAPALKQAEVGIAVASAADVAKSAASMVLTDPGLVDIVAAVSVSRRIYQRMMTWTLNKIIKTAQVAVFLALAFLATRSFVTTPRLVVLLLLANDFVTMSLAVDHTRASARPERWKVRALVAASLTLAVVVLAESFLDLWLARSVLHLGTGQTQTFIFLMLVFSGQATVYVVRERDRFWRSRPATTLLAATIGDLLVISALAITGTLMTPVAVSSVVIVLAIAVGFMFVMDPIKVGVLRRLGLAGVAGSIAAA